MTPNQFQKLALRTEVTPSYFVNDPRRDRLLHAAVGCSTEIAELLDAHKKAWIYGKPVDITNIREEAGDTLWYVGLGLDAIGASMSIAFQGIPHFEERPLEALARAQDACNVLHGVVNRARSVTEVEDEVLRAFMTITMVLLVVLEHHKAGTLSDAMAANIRKLEARYPGGFTQERAVERDLAAETRALEMRATRSYLAELASCDEDGNA